MKTPVAKERIVEALIVIIATQWAVKLCCRRCIDYV
jgi:hypothetical protein